MGGRGKVRVRPGQLGAGTAVRVVPTRSPETCSCLSGQRRGVRRAMGSALARAPPAAGPWAVTHRPLGSWLSPWARRDQWSTGSLRPQGLQA